MNDEPAAGKSSDEADVDIAAEIEEAAQRMELGNPDEGLPIAEQVINRIVEIVGVTALAAIVIIVFTNATSRYALDYSFSWAEEMVQMAMPWLAMTGVFLSVRRGTMIKIDFFFEKIPPHLQGAVANFGYAFNVAVLGLMAWVSVDFVRLFGGDVALYVEVPVGWSTSALVFGAAGAVMAYLAEFYREWKIRHNNAAGGGAGA